MTFTGPTSYLGPLSEGVPVVQSNPTSWYHRWFKKDSDNVKKSLKTILQRCDLRLPDYDGNSETDVDRLIGKECCKFLLYIIFLD